MNTFTLDDLPLNIRARTKIDPECGCWRCSLSLDKDGYARVAGRGAHRVVYELLVGEIEPGLVLDHVVARGCQWTNCIFPAHLEPVTQRINTLRGTSFAAVNFAKFECDHGHPFDLFNTYVTPDGRRQCRICNRFAVAEYKKRRRVLVTLAVAA